MIPIATKDMLTVKAAPSNRDVSVALTQTASPEMHFSLEFELRGSTPGGRQGQSANAVEHHAAGTASDIGGALNSTEQRIHAFAQASNSTSAEESDLSSQDWDSFTGKLSSDDTSLQDPAAQMPLEHTLSNLAPHTGEGDVADATQTQSLRQMPPHDPAQTTFPLTNVETTTSHPSPPATMLARAAVPLETAYSSISTASAWPAEGRTTRNNEATGQQGALETAHPAIQQSGKAITSLDPEQTVGRQRQQTAVGDLLEPQALGTKPESTTNGGAVTQTPLNTMPNHADSSTLGNGAASNARLEQSVSQNQFLSDDLTPAIQNLPSNSLGLPGDRMVVAAEQPPIANLTPPAAATLSTQTPKAEQRTASLPHDTRHVIAQAATIQPDSNGSNVNAAQALGAHILTSQTDHGTTTQPAPQQGATPQSDSAPQSGLTSTPVQVSAIRNVESGPMNAVFLGSQSEPESGDTSMLEPTLSRDFSTAGETRSDARLDRLATSSPQASGSNFQMSTTAPQAASTMLYSNPQAALNLAVRIQNDEAGFDPGDNISTDAAVAAHASTAARGEALGNIGSTAATIAQSVSRQIATTVVQMADQPVEIALSPEELGKVRLVLHASEHGMVVTVQAERPETLDLMRRNIGMLATDMRDLGYSELSFSFSDHPQQHSGQAGSDTTAQSLNRDGHRNLETAAPILTPPKTPHDANASGLDLRI